MKSQAVASKLKLIVSACVLLPAVSGAVVVGAGPLVRGASTAAALDQIVDHERAFSQLAGEVGMRAAFLAFIAEDGIIFSPAPVAGKASMANAPDWPGTMIWTPAFAGMSASGDLGFTTGPYVWKDATVLQTGQYLTIWRRQPNGEWRFVLDRGTPGPADTNLAAYDVTKLRVWNLQSSKSERWNAQSEVLAQERALSIAAQLSAVASLVERFACDARLLREGLEPAVTPAQRAKVLMSGPAAVRYNLLGSGTSAAGDLAYTYGETSWLDAGKSQKGYFVRLWQRQGTRWHIIFDSSSAIPPRARTS